MAKIYGQLERAALENIAGAASGTISGRVWWDTTALKAFVDDGTNKYAFLRNDSKAVFGNNGTANNNIRFHRGANSVLQFVLGGDTTAEGTLSTSLAQTSARQENYATGSLPSTGNSGRIVWDTTVSALKVDTGAAWKLVDQDDNLTTKGDLLVYSTTPSRLAVGSRSQVLTVDPGTANGVRWATPDPINYILNRNAETDVVGWATYADAAGVQPVNGTGGSPTITWTRSTTTPLRGVADFNFTKDANNRQGEGVSYDFTIDSADKAKLLTISFDYEVLSGTYADGDLGVYIYDVTNNVIIVPSDVNILNVAGTEIFTTTFSSAANSTSYRLIVHVASTSALAYTLAFDNFLVGVQAASGVTAPVVMKAYELGFSMITATELPLALSTVEFDSNSAYNSGTGEYTIPSNGFYRVTAMLYNGGSFTANTGAIEMYIDLDATRKSFSVNSIGTATSDGCVITTLISATAGQVLIVKGYQANGATRSFNAEVTVEKVK